MRYEITVGVEEEDLHEIIKALAKIDVRKIMKTLTFVYEPPLPVSKLNVDVPFPLGLNCGEHESDR